MSDGPEFVQEVVRLRYKRFKARSRCRNRPKLALVAVKEDLLARAGVLYHEIVKLVEVMRHLLSRAAVCTNFASSVGVELREWRLRRPRPRWWSSGSIKGKLHPTSVFAFCTGGAGAAIDDRNVAHRFWGVRRHAATVDFPHVPLVGNRPHRPGIKFGDVGVWSVTVPLDALFLGTMVWKLGPFAECRVRNPIFCPQFVEDLFGYEVWYRFHGRGDFPPNVVLGIAGIHGAVVVFHNGRKRRHDR